MEAMWLTRQLTPRSPSLFPWIWVGALCLVPASSPAQDYKKDLQPFLEKYCVDCHGNDKTKGDVNFEVIKDDANFYTQQRLWREAVSQVVTGEMPPSNRKTRPTSAEIQAMESATKGMLTRAIAKAKVDPGAVTIRRLNRVEYNNTIRDLCYLDGNYSADFPADDTGYGFDDIGDVLTFSPVHLERFMGAAEAIAERAMVAEGQNLDSLNADGYGLTPRGHSEGQLRIFNPNAALSAEFEAPRAGNYIFRASLVSMSNTSDPEIKVALSVDGKIVANQNLKNRGVDSKKAEKADAKISLTAGKHTFTVTWLNPPADMNKGTRRLGTYRYQLLGPSDTRTELERRLSEFAEGKTGEPRARAMANWFVSRAFRRPATTAEVQRYTKTFVAAEAAGGTWESGAQAMIATVLASPKFIFRAEQDEQPTATDAHPVSDFALASRLSYFLWGSMPDEELFNLAYKKELSTNLLAQAKRMLKDKRSEFLVSSFGLQWLQIRRLSLVTPDTKQFPEFDDQLRVSMAKETELFLSEIFREDRSVIDILDADFTYLDLPLANLYGINGVNSRKAGDFVRVKLPPGDRGGVLTQASILTATSNPTRTSPVKRGKWILEQILGTPPPPAPPEVPALEAQHALTGSLRQRMEQHRANPTCASCHTRMDAIGFAFEKFNAIGKLRETDEGSAIDPAGKLPDGRTFAGAAQFKTVIKGDKDKFIRNLSGKMLIYGLGRGLEYYDEPAVDKIAEAVAKGDNRISAMIYAVIMSDPFRLRRGTSQLELGSNNPKKK
jgi:cytochrome c553